MTSRHPSRLRPALVGLALIALVFQCWALYSPSAGGSQPFPHADKLVHLLLFGGVAWLFLLAGARRAAALGLSAIHAVVSEIVQWQLIPTRSGSALDLLADFAGIALAWLARSSPPRSVHQPS
ncbi:hypothetical protein ACTQ49_10340 [Luteococcus sp. Sow4_B9]|uniref:hypothetical protein n=1 Tax=Luteococcus sp. Sow4_B9 TaxID=3438792 RepID=UPI003F969622